MLHPPLDRTVPDMQPTFKWIRPFFYWETRLPGTNAVDTKKAQKSSLILRHFKLMVQQFSFVFPKLLDINAPTSWMILKITLVTRLVFPYWVFSDSRKSQVSTIEKTDASKNACLQKLQQKNWRQKWVGKTKNPIATSCFIISIQTAILSIRFVCPKRRVFHPKGCTWTAPAREGDDPQFWHVLAFNIGSWSSWWFQPIWKILYSQIGSFPQVGVKIKKYSKPPPRLVVLLIPSFSSWGVNSVNSLY